MEKLSSLTPEGAPVGKGENVFNPFVESATEATRPSFIPQPPDRSEVRTLEVRCRGRRGRKNLGGREFLYIPAFPSVSLEEI